MESEAQQQDEGRPPRAAPSQPRARSQQRRYYCYRCGTPWRSEWVHCERCGSSDRELGRARPRLNVPDDLERFGGPWKLLPWPGQGAVALYGGPGAGKSSLASLVDPRRWLTKEQEPKAVGAMFRRVTPQNLPAIDHVNSAGDVQRVLSTIESGPIVLDSLTAFGLKDALIVAHLVVEWARLRDDRALAVIQVNKDGQAAGYMEITHLFDAIVNVSPDRWGVRSFRIEKSRWSALEAIYWTFDADGKITVPDFPAAYSVEGGPGGYWLHPYPMKRSEWGGLLDVLAKTNALKPGIASAAVWAPYMPQHFLEPMDVPERRRFARANGLHWASPSDFPDEICAFLEMEGIVGPITHHQAPRPIAAEE